MSTHNIDRTIGVVFIDGM